MEVADQKTFLEKKATLSQVSINILLRVKKVKLFRQ